MAYLIGAILLVLFIALIFVFKPPKKIREDESAVQRDFIGSNEEGQESPLTFDSAIAEATESGAGETDDELLTFERSDDSALGETGAHDEEELDLTFDTPGPDRDDADVFGEELELDLEEGIEEDREYQASFEFDSVAELSDEPAQPVAEEVDEEEIPFIIEEEDSTVGEGEVSPALGDVPDDYAEQLDEGEAPEELAERLDFFLGSGDEEEEQNDTDSQVADQEPLEEKTETVDDELEVVEAEEGDEEEPEPSVIETGEAEQPETKGEDQEETFTTSEEEQPASVDVHAAIDEFSQDEAEEEIEEGVQAGPETGADESIEETLQPEADKTENDEDIVFMDEDESSDDIEEIAPALGDVPDDYAEQIDESEAPEELAERLDFFLGTGDEEELDQQVEEPVAEQVETGIEEEPPGEVDDIMATEEVVEEEPPVEAGPDVYSSFLARQEEKLRGDMSKAIQKRETGKIGLLGMALEILCTKQADISQSFQVHQQMLDAIDGMLNELQQVLPGFQAEAARSSLKSGDYDVVQTMLADAVGQLASNQQLAAKVLYLWGRFEEERGELSPARDLFDKGCSADPENLDCIFAAGRLARIGGDLDEAVSLLEQRVQSGTEKGEESIGMARAQFELAKTLAVLDKDTEQVEQLLNQSLATVEKTLGPDNPNLGPILHELAALHDTAGRHEQAEPFYKRSLEVVEKALGSDSPRLGQTLAKLAGLYEEMEKQDMAESFYRRALEIRQKVLGEVHPDIGLILGHLANILKAKGQYDQAEPMYKKSLDIAEATLGKDHPNLAMVYNEMFELYSEMGNEEQAGYYQEKAFSAFGMPGLGDGFVEMEKDTALDENEDDDQQIAGS